MTEPLDLDALRALTDGLPAGPWTWAVSDDRRWVDVHAPGYDRVIATTHDDDIAAFIAAARTAFPLLLDEVARLRAVVASVEALCDEVDGETSDGDYVVFRVRAALTAAQDAPAPPRTLGEALDALFDYEDAAPTPTEEATP